MSKKKPDGYLEISQEAWKKAEITKEIKNDWDSIIKKMSPVNPIWKAEYLPSEIPSQRYLYDLSNKCCPDSSAQKGEVKSITVIPVTKPKENIALEELLNSSNYVYMTFEEMEHGEDCECNNCYCKSYHK